MKNKDYLTLANERFERQNKEKDEKKAYEKNEWKRSLLNWFLTIISIPIVLLIIIGIIIHFNKL